jgi:hypothetical protein
VLHACEFIAALCAALFAGVDEEREAMTRAQLMAEARRVRAMLCRRAS